MTKIDDKRVPALRFKGFNDDWAQRKLGKLSKIKSGQTPSSHDNSNYYPPQINWIRTGDLTNSKIISVDKLLSKKGAEKLTVFPKNTVVIAMYGGFNQIGRTGLLTFPSTINQALAAISPNPLINSNFLLQLLNKNIYTWRRVAASSRKDPNITKKDIENQKFDFPSVFEQEKISKLISLIDKLITLQQRKLEQLKQIKKAYLKTIFSQNLSTCYLKDIAEYRRGSFPQPYTNREWYGGKNSQPFVQVADVGENLKLNSKTKETISVQAQPNSVFVPKDTILVTLQGSIGRVAITQYDSYVDRTLLIITKLKKQIDKYYLAYALQEKFNEEKRKAPGGTIKTITKSALSSFQIIVPSYEKQLQQSNILKKMDNEIELSQNKLKETNSLKQFFLQNMFI